MKHFDRFSDNAHIQSSNTKYGDSIENRKFNCVGNESAINDCPETEKECPGFRDNFKRTEITCESKMYFKYIILN